MMKDVSSCYIPKKNNIFTSTIFIGINNIKLYSLGKNLLGQLYRNTNENMFFTEAYTKQNNRHFYKKKKNYFSTF